MDNLSPPPCPNTVTVRRNPPRRARATPQSLNPRGTGLFPHDDDVLSTQVPQNPPAKSDKENLKVFLRIRPFPSPNQAPRARAKTAWPKNPAKKPTTTGVNAVKNKSSNSCISIDDSQSVTLTVPSSMQESKRVKSETYGGFTHVFPSDSSQSQVYERMVKPMVDEFLDGRSGMLAALGPSGSGKTHTVFGSTRDPGMVSLTLRHIFKESVTDGKHASRYFYIAIFEIYSERGKAEKLFDLLPDGGELILQQSTVKGLKEVLISNAEQAESLIAQAVIKRATAMTNTNSQSSRSQCIINIRDAPQKCNGVFNPKSNDAVLTIIDLAGAEREKRTGNQGTRLLESNFINNTLMVFSLCLRSLLEHQKNPKKPLQKHFQSSMLTKYLRDYLEGKKRMTLLLTAKSGEDDYLDTSYVLRQASPYMQIKYNEVEPSNMVPKKRLHQASIFDNAKQSPSLEHLKRKRLASEHIVQNAEKGIEECSTSKKDGSTVCKLDASISVSTKSECDSHLESERSHIIMRNFARVLWDVLKQYNSNMKVAEREIQSLRESIGYEKEKYIELEMKLNQFKASCTCCKGEKETFCKEPSSEPILVKSDDEYMHGTACVDLSFENSDDDHKHGTTCTVLGSENSDREILLTPSKQRLPNALEVDAMTNIPCEIFHAEASPEPRHGQSDDENMVGSTYTELDSDKSDREVPFSLSKLGQPNAFEVDGLSKIPSETFPSKSSSVPRLDESDDEHMPHTPCSELDSEKSDREVSSKSGHHNALEVDAVSKVPHETFRTVSSSEPRPDQPDDEHIPCTTCTKLDSEKSDREILSKPGHHNALEVDAVSKETFLPESFSQSDDEHLHGTTCTELDSEKSNTALEIGGMSKIPSETFYAQTSSVPRLDLSNEEPLLGTSNEGTSLGTSCAQLDPEKSDSLVLGVSSSSSKPEDHSTLDVDSVSKIPNESIVSSSLTKEDILDPSLPKDVSPTKTEGDIGGHTSCKPPKPKRTLVPSSSMLSRNLSTFDLFDESEKLKGNRGTRKSAAHDPKRSNGSMSLLHLLHGRQSNTPSLG